MAKGLTSKFDSIQKKNVGTTENEKRKSFSITDAVNGLPSGSSSFILWNVPIVIEATTYPIIITGLEVGFLMQNAAFSPYIRDYVVELNLDSQADIAKVDFGISGSVPVLRQRKFFLTQDYQANQTSIYVSKGQTVTIQAVVYLPAASVLNDRYEARMQVNYEIL